MFPTKKNVLGHSSSLTVQLAYMLLAYSISSMALTYILYSENHLILVFTTGIPVYTTIFCVRAPLGLILNLPRIVSINKGIYFETKL